MRTEHRVDRVNWPPGPWRDEVFDHAEFWSCGIPCVLHRASFSDGLFWHGAVIVAEQHEWPRLRDVSGPSTGVSSRTEPYPVTFGGAIRVWELRHVRGAGGAGATMFQAESIKEFGRHSLEYDDGDTDPALVSLLHMQDRWAITFHCGNSWDGTAQRKNLQYLGAEYVEARLRQLAEEARDCYDASGLSNSPR